MKLPRFTSLVLWLALVSGVGVFTPSIRGQDKESKLTAEQVAEIAISLNGSRDGLKQVRRTGVERGQITRTLADDKTEQATYELRIIRGDSMDKDRVRLDQKMPTAEYALVFSGGEIWGVINETMYTPKQEATQEFRMRQVHCIDTLLRYKENGSTLTYSGKEKQKGLEVHVLDVTDKEQRKTRFYISAKTARVLWLEYEQPSETGSGTVKFVRKFHDYRVAQGTILPYRSVLYKNAAPIETIQILTVTYGSKVDEAMFRNPNAPASETASKP